MWVKYLCMCWDLSVTCMFFCIDWGYISLLTCRCWASHWAKLFKFSRSRLSVSNFNCLSVRCFCDITSTRVRHKSSGPRGVLFKICMGWGADVTSCLLWCRGGWMDGWTRGKRQFREKKTHSIFVVSKIPKNKNDTHEQEQNSVENKDINWFTRYIRYTDK